MPFINEILKYQSLSIVGIEKNTGKTECLNYILNKLPIDQYNVCVTSIGLDGEGIDQVTDTSKPEISLRKGLFFATSEKHYKLRNVVSELIDISNETTSLGRIVTARAITDGRVLLSGPASTHSLKRWMGSLHRLGIDLTIIDGALSRLSSASPAVSEAMILSTGAAYSANMATLLHKSAFVVKMIELPLFEGNLSATDSSVQTISSLAAQDGDIDPDCKVLRVSGALTDRFLKRIMEGKMVSKIDVTVKDFTRIFVTEQTYHSFIRRGGNLSVEQKSKLIAVCVNPKSPNGYVLDSDRLCGELSNMIKLPVYDIVKNCYEV